MQIQVINTNDKKAKFKPIIGPQATELFERYSKILDEEELNNTKSETVDILSKLVDPGLNLPQQVTHLVVGYVQSGKTMSFTALSALAHDNGYRIIIYFAGGKNNLLAQTTKRLREDLICDATFTEQYKLFENPEKDQIQKFTGLLQMSTKPTILITVLKHPTHIGNLVSIFSDNRLKNRLGNTPVMIIDDEADQASLNGYAYKNSKNDNHFEDWEDDEYTATYREIRKLRGVVSNLSYVQYTATPQGPLLIDIMDMLSPKGHTVLTPGKAYTGGKTFFKEHPETIISIPEAEAFNTKQNQLRQCPPTMIKALHLHFMSVAIVCKIMHKSSFLSMMVHADRDQDASELFDGWVKGLVDHWGEVLNSSHDDIAYLELKQSFYADYDEAISMYRSAGEEYPTFDDIWGYMQDIFFDTNIKLLISRKNNKKRDYSSITIDWNSSCSHILVGAEMLNRGFTVEKLATTYMPRYSKGRSTADTIQQRCRFFGYKQKYINSCRVFLPEDVQIEYCEYVDHEEEMRQWLKDNESLENVKRQLILSGRLNPTRKNILSKNIVRSKLSGWRRMNTFQAFEYNEKYVNDFIAENQWVEYKDYGTVDRNHRFVKLPIDAVIDFLSNYICQNLPDNSRKNATMRYLKYLSLRSDNPINHAYIFQMAYAGPERERSFNDEVLKVNNLMSGRSNAGTQVYPGDTDIKFDDSITIQIHHVKLKVDDKISKWHNQIAYTLAIYYPEDLAINYVENPNSF